MTRGGLLPAELIESAGGDASARREFVWQRPVRVTSDGTWIDWHYLAEPERLGGADDDQFGFPNLPLVPEIVEQHVALKDFVALADADAARVCRFVEQYGPLYLCRHGFPQPHPVTLGIHRRRQGMLCKYVYGDGASEGRELVSDYRLWANRTTALLRLVASLSRGSTVGAEDAWATLGYNVPASPAEGARRVDAMTTLWLTLGDVRPAVHTLARPNYYLIGFGVFGVIALELARAMTGKRIAVCASCGRAFEPKAPPRRGDNSWCTAEDCQKASNAHAARASRRRAANAT